MQVHQIELEIQNDELRQAREELESLLEKYTDLYEFSPAAHCILDKNGDICSINLTGATLLGIERSRLVGNISLAQIQQHDPDKLSSLLAQAEQAIVRAKDLTMQLLTFAKGGQPVKAVQPLGRRLEEATRFATSGTAIATETTIAEDLWPVEIDASQIHQVIHNLI